MLMDTLWLQSVPSMTPDSPTSSKGVTQCTLTHCCRAKEILSKGKLFGVQQEEGAAALQLQAKCSGSGSEVYAVTAAFASRQADNDWAELGCTCPARGREEVCKHGVALLLWRIQQGVGAYWVNGAATGKQQAGSSS